MSAALEHAPGGACVGWGIPFEIDDVVAITSQAVSVELSPVTAQWLVFMHASDLRPVEPGPDGFISPMRGEGQLAEHAADYVMLYADNAEERVPIRRRHQIGMFRRRRPEICLEAVPQSKPRPKRAPHEQLSPSWGWSQGRVIQPSRPILGGPWINWLWAWENPHPEKAIVGIRFEPVAGSVVVFAISTGKASSQPLRWRKRRKTVFTLPEEATFLPDLDENGLLEQIQLDMGQIISAALRPVYPTKEWSITQNNQTPEISEKEVLVEYTAHPDACFHLYDGRVIAVSEIEDNRTTMPIKPVAPATQRVTLRAV
jgi:hypothetical protein